MKTTSPPYDPGIIHANKSRNHRWIAAILLFYTLLDYVEQSEAQLRASFRLEHFEASFGRAGNHGTTAKKKAVPCTSQGAWLLTLNVIFRKSLQSGCVFNWPARQLQSRNSYRHGIFAQHVYDIALHAKEAGTQGKGGIIITYLSRKFTAGFT